MTQVLVSNIQGYSLHDGPGIRTTVFLKGCNLRCLWCQNPEGLSGARQVGFIAHLCQGCGKCAKACENAAIVPDPGRHRIDYERCVGCGACAKACFHGALVAYGKPMDAQEVFTEVIKDKMFYDSSGGGVTVSGGEPMLHPQFVAELMGRLKEAGVHTALETAGCVPRSSFDQVMGLVDLYLYDIKYADPARHEELTGQSNTLILENAAMLVESGADVLFRMPLLSGVNDSADNIEQTADALKRIGNPRLQLMPYHRLGQSKYEALDMPYQTIDVPVMEDDEVEAVRQAFEDRGVECSISR